MQRAEIDADSILHELEFAREYTLVYRLPNTTIVRSDELTTYSYTTYLPAIFSAAATIMLWRGCMPSRKIILFPIEQL